MRICGATNKDHDAEHEDDDADAGGRLAASSGRAPGMSWPVQACAKVWGAMVISAPNRILGTDANSLFFITTFSSPLFPGLVGTTSALCPHCDEEHKSCFLRIYLVYNSAPRQRGQFIYNFSIGATRSMRRLTPAEPKSTVITELRPLSCASVTLPRPLLVVADHVAHGEVGDIQAIVLGELRARHGRAGRIGFRCGTARGDLAATGATI